MDLQHADLNPMKALVAAVVARACEDVKLGHRFAAEALEWFTERNQMEAWSFEWCCAILNLDPDAVREQLTGGPRDEMPRGGRLLRVVRP